MTAPSEGLGAGEQNYTLYSTVSGDSIRSSPDLRDLMREMRERVGHGERVGIAWVDDE